MLQFIVESYGDICEQPCIISGFVAVFQLASLDPLGIFKILFGEYLMTDYSTNIKASCKGNLISVQHLATVPWLGNTPVL